MNSWNFSGLIPPSISYEYFSIPTQLSIHNSPVTLENYISYAHRIVRYGSHVFLGISRFHPRPLIDFKRTINPSYNRTH